MKSTISTFAIFIGLAFSAFSHATPVCDNVVIGLNDLIRAQQEMPSSTINGATDQYYIGVSEQYLAVAVSEAQQGIAHLGCPIRTSYVDPIVNSHSCYHRGASRELINDALNRFNGAYWWGSFGGHLVNSINYAVAARGYLNASMSLYACY